MNWQEATIIERKKRDPTGERTAAFQGLIEPSQNKGLFREADVLNALTPYAQNIYHHSEIFASILADMLGSDAKVLDFGGSQNPWFSFLCSKYDLKAITYDITPPTNPGALSQLGILFINDDASQVSKYTTHLKDCDLVFCRNMSVPQAIDNWYESVVMNIWSTLLSIIKQDGCVYWIQMSNGSGKSDTQYANLSMVYFNQFFTSLGAQCVLSKYGYISFKVARQLAGKWQQHFIGSIDKRQDLLTENDLSSLVKWFGLQLQSFHKATEYNLDIKVEIRGPKIPAIIARTLLEDNFQVRNTSIIFEGSETALFIHGRKVFSLSAIGPQQDNYFIIDQQEDERFTDAFLQVAKRYF